MGVIAGLGRACFRYRWWVLLAWVLAVVAGVLAAGPVFHRLAGDNNPRHIEAIEAFDELGRGNDSGGEILALADGVDTRAERVRAVVEDLARDLAARPDVKQVAHPYLPVPAAQALVARDGGALLVRVTLRRDSGVDYDVSVTEVSARLRALGDRLRAAGQGGANVRIGGNPVLNREANQVVQRDLGRAELISLPVTLLVLVVVFGGLIAAGLPVIAAAVSVAAAMLMLLGFSYVTDLDQNTVTVVTLLGLGLSVDYGLLLVARYREERGSGFEPADAVARAWATAGRTILFSALTVAAALAGLLLFDIGALSALGAAGVSIALVAVLTSLTLTAALLGFARKRIKPTRRPEGGAGRGAAGVDTTEQGFFAVLSRLVQRWPWAVAVLTAALLLVAGAPLVDVTLKLPRLEGLPRSMESVQVADALATRFGLQAAPTVTVVARTDPDRLNAWAARWRGDPAVAEVRPAKAAGTGVSSVDLALRGKAQDDAAQALVRRIRADRPPDTRSWVTGDAAILVDLLAVLADGLPWAVAATLVAMALLLFAMTGSVVVPVKAILANVISLGATFGVLVAVFEHGFAAGLLHTHTIGGLSPFIVVIVFAFAFGLSMDYEVFLLARVKEYVELGHDSDTAVRRGLQRTGRIITSAALLMIVVFGCFAAADVGTIEQVGLGLTVAVLIDATVVRCLLVPATMTLLGQRNWWAPAPLRRLHARLGLRETVLPEPAEPDAAGPPEPVVLVKAAR